MLVKPSAFRLVSGEESLRGLRPKPEGTTQQCIVCGLMPFGRGNLPQIGGEYCSVNLRLKPAWGAEAEPART